MNINGFQNLDSDEDWKYHDPTFEWIEEDLIEFEREEKLELAYQEAMAGWWEMEGVRCATFGRDPMENPYK